MALVIYPSKRVAQEANDGGVVRGEGLAHPKIGRRRHRGTGTVVTRGTGTGIPPSLRTGMMARVGTWFSVQRAGVKGLKWTAAAYDGIHQRQRGITVLTYHRVGRARACGSTCLTGCSRNKWSGCHPGPVSRISIRPSTLWPVARYQMVPTRSWSPSTTEPLTSSMSAVPILVRCRIPVTIYVSTDFVETGKFFPGEGQPVSWAGLADSVSTGLVAIGSHTHSHALLDRLPAQGNLPESWTVRSS